MVTKLTVLIPTVITQGIYKVDAYWSFTSHSLGLLHFSCWSPLPPILFGLAWLLPSPSSTLVHTDELIAILSMMLLGISYRLLHQCVSCGCIQQLSNVLHDLVIEVFHQGGFIKPMVRETE